jgi:hypothetical protein
MGGIYQAAIDMGSGVMIYIPKKNSVAFSPQANGMIYIPSFIKFGSGIQKLIGRIHRQERDRISLLLGK